MAYIFPNVCLFKTTRQMRLFLPLFLLFLLAACDKTPPIPQQTLQEDVQAISDEIITARRHLHQHPELAGNEVQTQKYIEDFLKEKGIEILPNVYGHGVIGVINKGKAGKRVAWRADMDALPNNFPDELEFKSVVDGVQHGCGHDVHMAIGLGIAAVLAKRKDQIDGQVYFIFQPEEETFVGAKNMVDNGMISTTQIDEMYALHVTALPVGMIMVKPDELYAYQKRVQISLDTILPQEELSTLYSELRNQIMRLEAGEAPWNLSLAFDEQVGLHNKNTLFADYRIMDETPQVETGQDQTNIYGYIYETDASKVSEIIPAIRNFLQKHQLSEVLSTISFVQKNPTVINDEQLTTDAVAILSKHFGDSSVTLSHGQIPYFNDDFTYFQQEVSGVYFLLGGSNTEKGIVAMNHAPNFQVDEDCIAIGVERFATLLLERINEAGNKKASINE